MINIARVVEALSAANPSSLANPLAIELDQQPISGTGRAVITGWDWRQESRNDAPGFVPGVVQSGNGWRFTLRMRGTPAALLSAAEVLGDLRAPMFVELGASWTRAGLSGEEKLGQADLPMLLELDLLVLDFSPASETLVQLNGSSRGTPVKPDEFLIRFGDKIVVVLVAAACIWWVYSTVR